MRWRAGRPRRRAMEGIWPFKPRRSPLAFTHRRFEGFPFEMRSGRRCDAIEERANAAVALDAHPYYDRNSEQAIDV
jgi:hypothetical protein